MKLYTDKGNYQSIKLLLASFVTGETIEVHYVGENERPDVLQKGKLPVLEYEPDKHLVSANAACRYILAKKNEDYQDPEVDQLIDWEADTLQPLVHAALVQQLGAAGKMDDVILQQLHAALTTLNEKLVKKYFLVAKRLTAADIAIFATIYPLFSKLTPLPAEKNKHDAICTWYGKLMEVPPFVKAAKEVFPGDDKQLLKASILSQPAPYLPDYITQMLHETSIKFSAPKTGENPSKNPKATVKGAKTSDKVPKTSDKVPKTSDPGAEAADASAATRVPITEAEIAEASRVWAAGPEGQPKPVERKHPILPKEGARNYLITSALPYVNNVPHLGNIIGCVLSADVFSRYCRLRGYNCLYVCGTDEYGTATETKALEEGTSPRQICDKYHAIHAEVYRWFNIDFDYFGRTTTPHQTEIAQELFWKLERNGYILRDSVDQLQCQNCDRFLADRFVEGTCPLCRYEDARGDQCDKCGQLINAIDLIQPRCKVCAQKPVVATSQHLFMDLPQLEPLTSAHLSDVFESGIWTANAKQITNAWIRDGLKPRCITRDLKWGVPVPLPDYTHKVFYVWYEAPIGYISITANYTDQWRQWWKNPEQVELFNFMAKDNVPFHSVIFPSTLLGSKDDWTVVKHLSATEYLNYESGKFSKSRGLGVFGNNAKDTGIPADIWRFYLLYIRPEGQDSAFSWDDLMTKNNSELLNNLGNFINRALMFVSNQFQGVIPEMSLTAEDTELLVLVNREISAYVENMEKIRLREGLRNILTISRLGNQYIQANKPWVLVKGAHLERARAGTVVGLGAQLACLLASLLQPYLPTTCDVIRAQLQAPPSSHVISEGMVAFLPPGHTIGKPAPLFQKLEQKLIDEQKVRYGGKPDTLPGNQPGSQPNKQPNTQPDTQPANSEEVERLTAAVTEQGNKVRTLKTSGAEKAVVDVEVTLLLELKRQLAAATGQPINESGKGGNKKKGK